MRSLIEDLLAYSRAGAQREPEPVDLGRGRDRRAAHAGRRAVRSGAHFEVGPLPVVTGDRVQLEQLLQNLIGNASKFRDGPRAHVRVKCRAGADGGWSDSSRRQRDRGRRRARERIFKMFQRLHDRDAYDGTGIGLAICRKIVEGAGGRIAVRPARGRGLGVRLHVAGLIAGETSSSQFGHRDKQAPPARS